MHVRCTATLQATCSCIPHPAASTLPLQCSVTHAMGVPGAKSTNGGSSSHCMLLCPTSASHALLVQYVRCSVASHSASLPVHCRATWEYGFCQQQSLLLLPAARGSHTDLSCSSACRLAMRAGGQRRSCFSHTRSRYLTGSSSAAPAHTADQSSADGSQAYIGRHATMAGYNH